MNKFLEIYYLLSNNSGSGGAIFHEMMLRQGVKVRRFLGSWSPELESYNEIEGSSPAIFAPAIDNMVPRVILISETTCSTFLDILGKSSIFLCL